jgi:hypothetical protein
MSDAHAMEVIHRFKTEHYESTGGYRYNKHVVCEAVHTLMDTIPYDELKPLTFEQAVIHAGYNYAPVTKEDVDLWWEAQTTHADILVRCGKQYLDENFPDWRDQVNASRLDMSSGTQCILGQVFGEYDDGIRLIYQHEMEKLGEEIDPIMGNSDWARNHGFIDNGATYQALDEVWLLALEGEL